MHWQHKLTFVRVWWCISLSAWVKVNNVGAEKCSCGWASGCTTEACPMEYPGVHIKRTHGPVQLTTDCQVQPTGYTSKERLSLACEPGTAAVTVRLPQCEEATGKERSGGQGNGKVYRKRGHGCHTKRLRRYEVFNLIQLVTLILWCLNARLYVWHIQTILWYIMVTYVLVIWCTTTVSLSSLLGTSNDVDYVIRPSLVQTHEVKRYICFLKKF